VRRALTCCCSAWSWPPAPLRGRRQCLQRRGGQRAVRLGGGADDQRGRLFTQVGGSVEADDQFGAQLAAGDFNNNGFADLAAAAPEETVGTLPAAGAVSVLYGSGGGLTTTGGQLFTQNSAGVPGTAERGDRFGGTAFPLP
jgi:hypothetical protein